MVSETYDLNLYGLAVQLLACMHVSSHLYRARSYICFGSSLLRCRSNEDDSESMYAHKLTASVLAAEQKLPLRDLGN